MHLSSATAVACLFTVGQALYMGQALQPLHASSTPSVLDGPDSHWRSDDHYVNRQMARDIADANRFKLPRPKPDPKPDLKPEPKPEPKPELEPDPKPDPKPKPSAPTPKPSAAKPSAAKPSRSPTPSSPAKSSSVPTPSTTPRSACTKKHG